MTKNKPSCKEWTDHDNGDWTCSVRHVSGTCTKCGADLDKLFYEYKANETCWDCGAKGTLGRAPTGDWCNNCGTSDPGEDCDKCGREFIDPENHLNLKTNEKCK